MEQFVNEPLTDFSVPENREKMEKALADAESELGREWAIIIDGKRVKAPDQFLSHNPSDPEQVIGVFQRGTPQLAEKAIEAALRAFPTWSRVPPQERAEYCFKVADIMRRRRFELAAWMILEVGKNRVEADADVAEAIDLIHFYGLEAIRYAQEQPLVRIPTERNELIYIPLGVGIVIPPWNFPLAILGGMTAGAFVAGNTVVLKPSSDAPAMSKMFMSVLEEAGLPPGVVNLLTGPGGEIGDVLVSHPKTRFISFTGSKVVGLRINERAARAEPGQIWIKRVICEMGGKDPIIVDDEADMDLALKGVITSAYGYSGQKCSACSRLILVNSIYNEFVERLVDRTRQLKIGPAKDPETFVGPVINLNAVATISDYINMGGREGKLLCGGGRPPMKGYFIEPTIFGDVDRKATIAQQEIFGPVLTVIRAEDFKDATDIANDTEYGLTGSLYTKNVEKMRMARDRFHVGNLYINRKCTGALTGVHPFGGFNMSGTDSKAGGRDYLLLFQQAKCISEFIT
jgi:1-pyrroline-5-carboxylate dehydrogenase